MALAIGLDKVILDEIFSGNAPIVDEDGWWWATQNAQHFDMVLLEMRKRGFYYQFQADPDAKLHARFTPQPVVHSEQPPWCTGILSMYLTCKAAVEAVRREEGVEVR